MIPTPLDKLAEMAKEIADEIYCYDDDDKEILKVHTLNVLRKAFALGLAQEKEK